MSNSTQNDFSDTMRSNTPEKAKIMSDAYDRGLEKQEEMTQNDWEKEFDYKFRSVHANVKGERLYLKERIKDFIRKELADARREMVDSLVYKVEMAFDGKSNGMLSYAKWLDILATFRKEENGK